MKRIIVTPAGRKRYLEILLKYLVRDFVNQDFDEWHLWLNTDDKDDLEYMHGLAEKYPFIKTIPLPDGINPTGNLTIRFFFLVSCEPDAVYLRLDDDIVYVAPFSIMSIFKFRLKNPQYFLICGNTVNNSLCNYVHQHIGAIEYLYDIANNSTRLVNGYECMDGIGWAMPYHAEFLHRQFLAKDGNNSLIDYRFGIWQLPQYERISINVISWLGSDFNEFYGKVGRDEEDWLAQAKPRELGRMNVIYGSTLFSHFAFHTQREHLEKNTDILKRYAAIAPETGGL